MTTTDKQITEAEQVGSLAYRARRSIDENPFANYPQFRALKAAWDRGWKSGLQG
jgi:hypothetical protein